MFHALWAKMYDHRWITALIILVLLGLGYWYGYIEYWQPQIDGIDVHGATSEQVMNKVTGISMPQNNSDGSITQQSLHNGKATYQVENNVGKYDHIWPKQAIQNYWTTLYGKIQSRHLNSKKLPAGKITFNLYDDQTGNTTKLATVRTDQKKPTYIGNHH